jgi:hypothetical protein
MDVSYDEEFEVPMCALIGPLHTFHVLIEACGKKGVIGAPEKIGYNLVRFPICW